MGGVIEIADQIILNPTELLDAIATFERQAAVLALATRRLEVSGEWATDGSVSMPAWLRANARLSNRDAHRIVRRGRSPASCPPVSWTPWLGCIDLSMRRSSPNNKQNSWRRWRR
jgi:hypothetical protein